LPDDKLPTPPEAMAADGSDCVHPSPDAYRLLAYHYYNSYYRERFHPAQSFACSGFEPGLAGALNTLTASGLEPGQNVLFVFGYTPALDTSIGCPHAFLGVGQIAGAFALTADATGTAATSFHIGADLKGRIVLTQA